MSLFNTITIRTPESVELEFTLAGIGSRALALLVDYLLIALLLSVVSFIATFLQEQVVNLSVLFGGGADYIELWLVAIALLVTAAVYGGYFVGFETWWQGQTPGKRLAKIRVIRDNGKPEGVFQATLRSLMRPIDDILFVGFFFILFNAQEKRIGDWLAGTLVIQSERPIGEANVSVTNTAETLGQTLIEQADMGQLLPDDFAMLREYLQRRTTLTKRARKDLSMNLARQVREIIHLENLPQENLSADAFLEAVYWAYQKEFGRNRRSPLRQQE